MVNILFRGLWKCYVIIVHLDIYLLFSFYQMYHQQNTFNYPDESKK